MPAADEGRRLAGQQLPEPLGMAIAHIAELGGIIAERYADHEGRVHPSRVDRVAREVAGCNEAIEAIRAEHAQRVTLQHHVADQAQRVADLEAERDWLAGHVKAIARQLGDESREVDDIAVLALAIVAERDELRRIVSAYSPLKEATSALSQAREAGRMARRDRDALAARLAEIERAEPVAWIEHELQGTGLRHLHFERRPNTLRDDVVAPVWTPLIARPAATLTQPEPKPCRCGPDGCADRVSCSRGGEA